MANIFKKIGGFVTGAAKEVKTYWNKPKPGEYVSYKEFTSYIVGTSGCNGLGSVLVYISFGAGCVLIGKIYEIPMAYFAILGILGIPMTYLASPINMMVQDNLGNFDKRKTIILNSILIPLLLLGLGLYFVPQEIFEHILPSLPQVVGTIIVTSIFNIYYRMLVYRTMSKKFGKFRPFVIAGIVPFMISLALIIYLPYNSMDTHTRFWILHLVFSFFNIFAQFSQQVGSIGNVISPSSEERAKIMSIGGFVFSLIPSLVGILLPVFAGLTGGFESLNTYRIIFPIFAIVMSVMGLCLVFGVKEKVIVSRTHTAKINFSDGAKHVLGNRNYLVLNFANFFNCLSQGAVALNFVLFIYVARNSILFGVYSGIIGTACIPGLLLAPWLIKKFGKKKLVLISRLATLGCSILVYPIMLMGSIPLFILLNYFQTMIAMPAGISTQAMNADVWDELQLKSGQRLDGMTGIFGLMQTPFYALAGLMLPAIYLTMGFTSDWNIMYVESFRTPIVNITVIVGIVVALLSCVPFIFYNLTEKKHKEIMETLKSIAVDEGGLEDQDLIDAAAANTAILNSDGYSTDGVENDVLADNAEGAEYDALADNAEGAEYDVLADNADGVENDILVDNAEGAEYDVLADNAEDDQVDDEDNQV